MSLPFAALLQIVPLAVVFVILYFAYIRPQQRRVRAYQRMLRDLGPGDQVVTEGGLYARVAALLGETDLILELSPDVQFKARKRYISEIVAKAPVYHDGNSAVTL